MPRARSVGRLVFHALPSWTVPLVRRVYCGLHGLGDRRFVARTRHEALPPAALRFHVGSVRAADFVRVGRRCADDLGRALLSIDRSWESFERGLDFGCGCGRTLFWLRDRGPRWVGTDLHGGCIDWARSRLSFARIERNEAAPPLGFPAESFDLVYSLSVFTHLDETDQRAWLAELRRVSRPGAILLLSVHGRSCWHDLSPAERERLERRGFLALPARGLAGVFARYYNAYHAEPYVRETWGEYFTVRNYLPRGLNEHQDLVLLSRP